MVAWCTWTGYIWEVYLAWSSLLAYKCLPSCGAAYHELLPCLLELLSPRLSWLPVKNTPSQDLQRRGHRTVSLPQMGFHTFLLFTPQHFIFPVLLCCFNLSHRLHIIAVYCPLGHQEPSLKNWTSSSVHSPMMTLHTFFLVTSTFQITSNIRAVYLSHILLYSSTGPLQPIR